MAFGRHAVPLPQWAMTLMYSLTAISVSLWIFGGYTYWLRPVIRYTNIPFPVTTREVAAGEHVSMIVEHCNDDDNSHTFAVSRELVSLDSARPPIHLRPGLTEAPPGCERNERRGTMIPLDTPPGHYYLRGFTEDNAGPRSFVVPWRTREFVVVPPRGE